MKVMILVEDIYDNVGGGQSVYKKFIESNKDIDFYSLTTTNLSSVEIPNNLTLIKLEEPGKNSIQYAKWTSKFNQNLISKIDRIASSISGMDFDVIEYPDYETYGKFLRSALKNNKVKFKAISLSMHGSISNTLKHAWGATDVIDIEELEEYQYVDADGRYSISEHYAEKWKRNGVKTKIFDPAFLGPKVNSNLIERNGVPPDLVFVGRLERLKGPDIFIEICKWLPNNLYGKILVAGGNDFTGAEDGALNILNKYAKNRNIEFEYIGVLTEDELKDLYQKNCYFIIPSREDSLNLVSLNASYYGAAQAISNKAGICRFLEKQGFNFLKINVDNLNEAVSLITKDLLKINETASQKIRKNNEIAPDLLEYYGQIIAEAKKNNDNFEWYRLVNTKSLTNKIADSKSESIEDQIEGIGCYNLDDVNTKLNLLREAKVNQPGRFILWKEVSRLEEIRGNKIVSDCMVLRAAKYKVATQVFDDNIINQAIVSLNSFALDKVAEAIKLIREDKDDEIIKKLKKDYEVNLRNSKVNSIYEKNVKFGKSNLNDTPKVSVIVSLYNAASKLKLFLNKLELQSFNNFEVILIDSGSPGCEFKVLRELDASMNLDIKYVRTKLRETIQAAWNHGINLSNGEYLVFLGVDEALYPDGLEKMANLLDNDSEIDWVMGNSLVTEVDSNGNYVKDIMLYDRQGLNECNELMYLETCYISYVAGMYRKKIHEQYGFYDETFSGAGDTEFKCRVMKNLKVRHINKTLGVFLNYPDGQTTASCKAELEDIRAWYLYRTRGALKYIFEKKSNDQILEFIKISLSYRKSYLNYNSFDIGVALAMMEILKTRGEYDSKILERLSEISSLQNKYDALNYEDAVEVQNIINEFNSLSIELRERLQLGSDSLSSFTNDNRYEQHFWVWRS